MPNVSATLWSCCCARRNGFSRRWDSGAVVAIEYSAYSTLKETCARLGFASSGSVGHAARRSS